ncbi:MAG: S1 family peptidase [Myxococcales bacterium]|nr:S1 family peptidase [Myxococcales bacterium]
MSTLLRVHSHLLPVLASLGLIACTTGNEVDSSVERSAPQALIGGEVDEGDPAVVALTRGGNSSFCTGTLISPRVILTAAHCIDMLGSDPNAAIYFGSDTTEGGGRITVGQKKQHPLWTGDLSGGHDIGMLLMDFPYQDPSIAKRLNSASPASGHIGDDYRHVGFGVYDRDTGEADGQKRQGTTTIIETRGDVIVSGDSNLSVCFGDSGGPAFLSINEEEVVAGVHSYTSGDDCFPPNGDTDVQIYANDFILPWVQENDPSCGLDGVCGMIGCEDDPDCQPCGPDGTCVENCDLPDPDCQTQELGDICKANSQCTTDNCVAYRDEPEYRFCSESCELGSDSCPDGMSCQLINPFGNICYYDVKPPGALGDACDEPAECGSYQCANSVCVVTCDLSIGRGCPEGFECESRDDGENYHCLGLPSEEGGCRVASSGQGCAPWLLLLALAVLRRRRRS